MTTATLASIAVLMGFLLFWFIQIFRVTILKYMKRSKELLRKDEGQPVRGRVLTSELVGLGRMQMKKIKVEFENLSKSVIKQEFMFKASQVDSFRFEEGNSVDILLQSTPDGSYRAVLAGMQTKPGKIFYLTSLILIGGFSFFIWYLYTASFNAVNQDWSKADNLFIRNDAMPMMGIILTGTLGMMYVIFRVVSKSISGNQGKQDTGLLFKGIATQAKLLSYSDTNVTINNNPMVKFNYAYQDRHGNAHEGSDKVIVNRLEIGKLDDKETVEIMYHHDRPSVSKMTDNIQHSQATKGCVMAIFYFVAFVFSVVLFGLYLGSLPG